MIEHDQDVLKAIKAQARIGSTPISEFQIDHVYDIGQRSKRYIVEAAYEAMAKLRSDRNMHDFQDCSPEDPQPDSKLFACDTCTIVRNFNNAVQQGRQLEQASSSRLR